MVPIAHATQRALRRFLVMGAIQVRQARRRCMYQREIGRRHATNVKTPIRNRRKLRLVEVRFCRRCAGRGGQFAIVDGQHQTTAAILRGQEKVSCQVVQADRAKQAAAYAAVNGNTRRPPLNSFTRRYWQQRTR